MSFKDKLKKMVEEAPVVTGRGNNVNFGPMTITPIVVKWKGKGEGNIPDKVTLDDYMKAHKLKDSDDIELADNESFQLHYDIDVSDLNPSLNFHYERDVRVLNSNKTNKDPKKWVLTDWEETVLPSQIKVFGEDWYETIIANGKKPAPVVWVAAENVDSLLTPKEGKKNHGVPKFLALYNDRDECIRARDERYPPREESGQEVEEDTETNEEEGGFPADVLESAVKLYDSTRKNSKATLKMLESMPFGEYDPKELLRAAVPGVVIPNK